MTTEVWTLELYIDEWEEDQQGIYGYYSSEELAWQYALYYFNFYRDYRVHRTHNSDKNKWIFWYYTSMYKGFKVKKIEIIDKFEVNYNE